MGVLPGGERVEQDEPQAQPAAGHGGDPQRGVPAAARRRFKPRRMSSISPFSVSISRARPPPFLERDSQIYMLETIIAEENFARLDEPSGLIHGPEHIMHACVRPWRCINDPQFTQEQELRAWKLAKFTLVCGMMMMMMKKRQTERGRGAKVGCFCC